MTSLQGPGRQNDPQAFADLVARLTEMRREMSDMTSSLLRSAGIRVSPEGMSIESALEILGSLDVSGDLNVTGSATFSGDTTIGGNARITGTLSLPAGIIDNEALASPLVTAHGFGDADGFGLTPTRTTITSMTLTVPAGFTTSLIIADGVMFALNPLTTVDYLYARVYIDSPTTNTWGRELTSMMGPNNGSAALAVNKQARITGLTGGQTITVRLTGMTAFDSMSSAVNGASINAVAIFARG